MKRSCSILLAFATTLAIPGVAEWPIPLFPTDSYSIRVVSSLAYDAEANKLYAGLRTIDQRALAVFDTDAQGVVTGSCRRYAVYPAPIATGNEPIVQRILIDKRHRQLFLGLSFSAQQLSFPIVTLPLDAAGEPAGAPTGYDMGSPQHTCNDLALHPFTNRLYAVGWGGAAVYALNLDAGGTPTGAPVVFPVGSYGKYSIQIRPDASKLYLGTYPSVLEVCDLNASGNVVNAMRRYPLTNGPNAYLFARASTQAVCFANSQNRLAWYPLNAAGEPTGSVNVDSNRHVQKIELSPSGTVVLAESIVFNDAISGVLRTNGFQIREHHLFTNGIVLPPVRESAPVYRFKALALSAQPHAVAAVDSVSGFLGNTYSGLLMRVSVPSLAPASNLAVTPQQVAFGLPARYLAFAHARALDTVYAAGSNALYAYSLAGTGSLSSVGSVSNSGPVAVDDDLRLLYAARNNGVIEIRALDPAGAITGEAFCVASGMGAIRGLALNPVSHHLYMLGNGGTAGPVTNPVLPEVQRLVKAPVGPYVNLGDVDPVRGRLYATDAYAPGHSNLLVWTLAPSGTLVDTKPRRYADGIPLGTNAVRTTLYALALDAGRNRLLVGGRPESGGDISGWIASYPLNEEGDPAGAPVLAPSPNAGFNVGGLALSGDGSRLYEGGQGDARLFIRTRDAAGDPVSNSASWAVASYGKTQLALSTNEAALLAGTYPSVLQIVPLQGNGLPRNGVTGVLSVDTWSTNLGYFCEGATTSGWVSLDAALTNGTGMAEAAVNWSGGSLSGAVVSVEIGVPGGGGIVVLTNLLLTLNGNTATLLLPRYGLDPGQTGQVATLFEDADAIFARYRTNALNWAVAPKDRPRRFTVSNAVLGLNSGRRTLEDGLEAAALLGHNTLEIRLFSSQLTPEIIRAAAISNGITGFRYAVYNPPSYFDYNTNLVAPDYLDDWASGFRDTVAAMGGRPDELRLFKMADEPGWYFPSQINTVTSSVSRLTVFRNFLGEKGFDPAFFGRASWEDIFPMPLSGATNLPSKRLLFWTARFYTESLAGSFAAATAALQRQFHPNLFVTANLNNWPGRFFIPSPNAALANNPDVGPDSAMGMPDWFDLGRKKAVSCLWTEDWFADRYAQRWSFYADLLRCAAREGGLEYGAYVVGQSMSGMPDGGALKILALAGHGAKVFDIYTFASWYAFGNCWSERPWVYRSVADGLRLLGRAEHLLYEGRPRNAPTALLLSQAGQVWDTNSTLKLYLNELYGLHAGLTHVQAPVDIVDDVDLENGILLSNRYEVLYVSAPNLSTNAQRNILDWVSAGGTLALLPGACMADEYNEPAGLMGAAMGASWGYVERLAAPSSGYVTQTWITVTDARLGVTSDVSRAQTAPLTPAGATVLARFANGTAALTEKAMGTGRILAYGWWPGSSYMLSKDEFDMTRLPIDWSPSTRQMLAAPVRLAGTQPFVRLDREGVEAALLDSRFGTAVTLLNWTGEPVANLRVEVPLTPELERAHREHLLRVVSAGLGPRSFTVENGAVIIALPLATVDVLSVEAPRPAVVIQIR